MRALPLLFAIIFSQSIHAKRVPNAHWPKTCEQTVSDISQLNQSPFNLKESQISQLIEAQNPEKPQFIAIVVHGLNLKPSKMAALEKLLLEKGGAVLRVALEGHRGSLEEQKIVTWSSWQDQFHEHYCLAQEIAKKHRVPLINLSFSLGALVSLGHVANQEHWPYRKAIFIAPAAWIHWYGKIPAWFSFLGRGLGIPSKNLKDYRAEDTTSMAAYEAMANGRNEVAEISATILKNEALVIIDPDDELVSLKKTKEFIAEKGLEDFWQIFQVNNNETTLKKSYHHLIIDEPSLGTNQWNALQQRLSDFLEGTTLPPKTD